MDQICDPESAATQTTVENFNRLIWSLIDAKELDRFKVEDIVVLASLDHSVCRYMPNGTLFVSKVGLEEIHQRCE